ncbi:uncharacterized protein LOC133440509 [Cololabis saira]|uniref:uncharacterized protein LOC133440509 n=1 Tax=Cololabis saira TaxID=129043 RepID=UPI002AD4866B|nr:uncharacterized protein LOC133440509 [Cololabis saira]
MSPVLSHLSSARTKQRWILWTFLSCMFSGCLSVVSVHQPAELAAALGRDVVLPCSLRLSEDEHMLTPPVLYWLTEPEVKGVRLWSPTEAYVGRVDLLNHSTDSLDRSLLLRAVRWTDSNLYKCKVSIRTRTEGSTRKTGDNTALRVHDSLVFNLTRHNASLLRCHVNVSPRSGFVLSVLHAGQTCPTVAAGVEDVEDVEDAAGRFTTLSQTVALQGPGNYECQLSLGTEVVARSVFCLDETEEAGDAEKPPTPSNQTCSDTEVTLHPEPWPLYISLLLVSSISLLSVVTVMLVRR